MRAELSSIKQGSRVVYAVGGVEHNAIALGAPSEGFNQGIRLATISLNLIYLTELGQPLKVVAAPLLGVAADDEHLADVAQIAAQKTQGYVTSPPDVKKQIAADHLAHIKAHPRTNGWRPYVEGELVAVLKARIAQMEQEAIERNAQFEEAFAKSTSQSDTELALALLSKPEVALFLTAPENQELVEAALHKGRGEDPDEPGDESVPNAAVAAETGNLEDPADERLIGEANKTLTPAVPEAPADPGPAPTENPDAASDAEQEADKAAQSQAAEPGE